MTAVVNYVLSQDVIVSNATDSYVDDIIVDLSKVQIQDVKNLLTMFGLTAKPSEMLCGGRVLGLRVFEDKDGTKWKRDNIIASFSQVNTKRQLFSWCGIVIGHYPLSGWWLASTSM